MRFDNKSNRFFFDVQEIKTKRLVSKKYGKENNKTRIFNDKA